jgi:hypothetical protein
MIAADAAEKVDAADLRHALIGHDDMDRLLVQKAQPVPCVRGAQDAVIVAQQIPQALHYVGFVIDNQKSVTLTHFPNSRGLTGIGRWNTIGIVSDGASFVSPNIMP